MFCYRSALHANRDESPDGGHAAQLLQHAYQAIQRFQLISTTRACKAQKPED
jgi:hypothetical protein